MKVKSANTAALSKPDPSETGWPRGVPYIVGNEGCERFSFYGMRAILWLYVVMLYQQQGMGEKLAQDHATATVHLFQAGVYALPMIGALIADRLLGKYRTILWLSWVYCLGHLTLSLTEGSEMGLYVGLGLIAIGSGGIKPCVSANVGDQFGRGNWHLLRKVYQIFYFMINFGSFFATLMIPWIRSRWGWSVAFAVPGVLMFLATVVFWLGRKKFVHVPPSPGGRLGLIDALCGTMLFMTFGSLFFTAHASTAVAVAVALACLLAGLALFQWRQKLQPENSFLAIVLYALRSLLVGKKPNLVGHFGAKTIQGPIAVLKIISIFFLVSVFWALFDQHSSSWIRQATLMNREFNLPWGGTVVLTPDQIPSANPALVMLLIPFLSGVVYPLMEKCGFTPTPLRRMSIGMMVASIAFAVVALIQHAIDGASHQGAPLVHVAWQFIPYVIITTAEIMVSVTGLEFAYSQAPKNMKSIIMGFWLLTVALGNVFVAALARFGNLELVNFFWTFAALMAAAAVLFAVRAYFYQPREFVD